MEYICKLCKHRRAGKKEAHIVPKFITRALFDTTLRYAEVIQNGKTERKVQDTYKVPHIFCDECEKRFEVIETFIARKIQDIHNCKYLPEYFEYKVSGVNKWIECISISTAYFYLFFYSILWRVSVSNKLVDGFKAFLFDDSTEETIRCFLDANLSIHKKQLQENIDSITEMPYYIFVFKPENRLYPPQSTLAAQSSNNIHILSLGEFFIMFYINETDMPIGAKVYANYTTHPFKIVLADKAKWLHLNSSFTKLNFSE